MRKNFWCFPPIDAQLCFYGISRPEIHLLVVDRLDVVCLNSVSSALRYEVAQNGRVLFEREKGEFISFCIRAFKEYEEMNFLSRHYYEDKILESCARRFRMVSNTSVGEIPYMHACVLTGHIPILHPIQSRSSLRRTVFPSPTGRHCSARVGPINEIVGIERAEAK